MKIGTMTFFGSHNYGSVLQAYALQQFIVDLFQQHRIPCEYRIIGFRSAQQQALYLPPKADSPKNVVKRLMYLPYKRKIDRQHDKFERFIAERLFVTEPFSDPSALPERAADFDVLLSGSDQVWNVRAKDFSYAYLFDGCGGKKISYAASLGPLPIDRSRFDAERYAGLLRAFASVSVRETQSREALGAFLDEERIALMPDPVFLLSAEEWRKLESEPYPDRYILFYCLEPSKAQIRLAKRAAKQLGLPVVITGYRNKNDWMNPFVKLYDAGPCDFLSLIDRAALVLTSSFHGTAFSLIFGKPFLAIDGMADARIRDLLTRFGAERNGIAADAREISVPPVMKDAETVICGERAKARAYLEEAFGLREPDRKQKEASI
ncbi:MAG: polysaccharide pyruvyl transferase family protein [Clostridia bacterium]|nr:polysaccharide pyruvyl transferase family protein [Clostridia bacterium]